MGKFVILLLLLFQVEIAFGQLHFYPKVGLNTSFTSISEDSYVNKGFINKPGLFNTYGLGVSKKLTERVSFQGEVLLPTLGHRVVLTSNYIGNKKWQNKYAATGYVRCQQLNLNLQIDGKTNDSGWTPFAMIGASGYFKVKKTNFSRTDTFINVDPKTGIEDSIVFNINETATPFFRPGVLLGLGIKRTIKPHNYFTVGLTFHKGFSPLTTTKVKYQIEGQTFENLILNKGSALSIVATYGFSIRKNYSRFPEIDSEE